LAAPKRFLQLMSQNLPAPNLSSGNTCPQLSQLPATRFFVFFCFGGAGSDDR
jgi:hypothetical protein